MYKPKIVNLMPQEDIDYIIKLLEHRAFDTELIKIGEGTFGEVYKYKDYAIKVYQDELDGEILEKLQGNIMFLKLYMYIPDELMVTELLENYYPVEEHPHTLNYSLLYKIIYKYAFNKGFKPYDLHGDNILINKFMQIKVVDVGNFRKHKYDNITDYFINEPLYRDDFINFLYTLGFRKVNL